METPSLKLVTDGMSDRIETLKFILFRAIWSLFAIWFIVSMTFLLLFRIPDYSHYAIIRAMAEGGASQEEIEETLEALEPDESLWEEYVEWVVQVFTFDFGPVSGEIIDAMMVTMFYLIPSIVVAFVGAMLLGYYSAVRRNSIADYFLRSSSYIVFAFPNFLGAAIIMGYLNPPGELPDHWILEYQPVAGELALEHAIYLLMPAAFMTTHLMAIQLRYARAESLEYMQETFVKTVRAKGAHPLRVARHVLRTAAAPLFTLFIVEVIGILLVTIFVIETVFNVPGIGAYAYDAVMAEAILEVLIVTMLFCALILIADFLQDVSYALLDPRIGSE